MQTVSFDPIDQLVGQAEPDSLMLMRFSGPVKALVAAKRRLTVRNKSVAWGLAKYKKTLKKWSDRPAPTDPEQAAALVAKLLDLTSKIADLESRLVERFYAENDDGSVTAPAGYWFLAGQTDGSHINDTIRPVPIDGMRPYQIELLTELMRYKRATGVLATGLGKSLVIAALCRSAHQAGKRCIVVVPTADLVRQSVDTIKRYVDKTTGAGGGRQPVMGSDVLVTTAASAMKWVADYDVVIIDESHHSPAATWMELLGGAERATHCYNLTATAFRSDGLDMAIHGFGGPVVYQRDAKWGIENDWLCRPKIYCAEVMPHAFGKPFMVRDVVPSAKAYRLLGQHPDVLAAAKKWLVNALKAKRRVMVLFKTIPAGEAFKAVCSDVIQFEVAHSQYRKPLADFRAGTIDVLVSNDRLVGEGIDIPDCDALLLLTQHSSPVITYQALGRVLRKSPGKKDAIIIDISVTGYTQFEQARHKRAEVYVDILDGKPPIMVNG